MTHDEIFAVIRRNLIEVVPELAGSPITPEQSMRDLGANSIDRLDVVIAAQDDLGIKVPASELAKADSLGALSRIFSEYVS
ncbi:phosphopantetheine-binding protein [Micromonospora sp. NBS 11-29]|uniref:phosphopantetheine-binding protein n=1 Tax=Micromonospora sp. NBS 11-29 TaxID=1960879 RepID=UPI000B77B188|nr:phosphopantetheine-binding protein [Micromonospora sp. NBS 11-29]